MSDLAAEWDAIEVPSKATGTAAEWDAIPVEAKKAAPSKVAIGSDIENFFAGVGKGVVDLGRGAKQMLDVPAMWLESKFPGISEWSQSQGLPSAAKSSAETNAAVRDERALSEGLMSTKAGVAGNITGQVAGTLLPLGVASKVAPALAPLVNPASYSAAAASGALQGALQPVVEGESRGMNAAVGAGAGMAANAVTNAVGRLAKPVASVISDAHKKAVQVLQDAGIPLDAAQLSGSTFLNKIKSSFSDNPFTAGAQSELRGRQQAAYNQAVLKTIGESSDAATSAVMGKAEKRINGVFKDVLNRNSVALDDTVLGAIGTIQKRALEEEKKPIAAMANRIVDAIGDDGTVSGQIVYGIKKDLDRLAKSQDSTLAHYAGELRSTLMDAINNSLSKSDKAAFGEARRQFGNMRTIEKAIDKEGLGNISPAQLANVMGQVANRAKSVYGKGNQELVDLAQAGKMLLTDKTPNSGTTARAAMQLVVPILAGGAQGAYTGDWEKAVGTGLSLYAAPKVAQAAINNPAIARYLASGMQGRMMPLRDLLLLPENNAAVGGAIKRAMIQSGQQPVRNIYESVGMGNQK